MENKKHLGDKFINGLRTWANDLSQVQVDAELGKADAKDKWEEYTRKFNKFIHESKLDLHNGTGVLGDIRAKAEHLEVQLELGKTELKDKINEEKKKIDQALQELDFILQGK